ncbi:MAG: insulinase family protein [Porticoccus sp.]
MNRIAVVFVYLLIAVFGASQALAARPCHGKQVAGSDPIAQRDSIVRSDSDHSEYRYLQLPNQLQVLLVSDKKADKAVAALDVFVGSSHDPVQRQGLAHFLEHMLFLGTDRYPEADEYQAFISQHGGRHNAYTSFDHTNYFFDINPGDLEPALDRFSRFFVAPLFNAEYVEREKNAVHSEYKARIKNDYRRQLNVFSEVVNAKHPSSKFSVGNLNTLADTKVSTVREDLVSFYQQHYSANRMTLVVLAPNSLDELESMVRPRFEVVPNSDSKQPKHGQPLFEKGQLPLLVSVQPVQELRALSVTIPLPAVHEYYRQKPLAYLGNLIGHEGKGSLLSLLKENGWAEGLRAGEGLSDQSGSSFDITVGLTPDGLSNWQQVLELIFQEIALVVGQGVAEWRHREQGALVGIQFRHKELGDPVHRTSQLANQLHKYPYKDVMRGPYRMDMFDSDLIAEMLGLMTPENALVTLMAPEVDTNKVSSLYQVPYSVIPLPKIALGASVEGLQLPKANNFVPDNFALNHPANLGLKEGVEPGPPELLVDKPGYRLWNYSDSHYQVPKAQFYVAVKTPAIDDAQTAAMADLYLSLVRETLNESSYEASLAGLGYGINRRPDGVGFVVNGFDSKLPVLTEAVVGAMLKPEISDELVARLRAELIRKWRNSTKDTPYKQLMREAGLLLNITAWQPVQLADALEDFDRKVFDQFVAGLYRGATLEMLASGNLVQAEVEKLGVSIAGQLVGENHEAWVERGVIRIPPGEKIHIPLSIDHKDAAILRYYQGRNDSLDETAKIMLLRQLIKSEFFHQLRTEQQLGYVVAAIDQGINRVPGIGLLMQSPTAPVSQLEEAVEQFLVDFDGQLQEMPDAEFESHRQAVLISLREQPKSLSEQSSRFWGSIDLRDYGFHHRERLIKAVASLTHENMTQIYSALLMESGYSLQVDSTQGGTVDDAKLREGREVYRLPSKDM